MHPSLALFLCAVVLGLAALILLALPQIDVLKNAFTDFGDKVLYCFALVFFIFAVSFSVLALLNLIPEPTPWH